MSFVPSQAIHKIVNFSSKATYIKSSRSACLGLIPRGDSIAEKEPENIEIKRLRQEQRQRSTEGKHPRFTDSAVYKS